MFGEKSFKLISVIIIIISIIFGARFFPIFGERIQNFLQTIIPELMLDEFSDFQYSRIEIWRSGINLAIDNPFFELQVHFQKYSNIKQIYGKAMHIICH